MEGARVEYGSVVVSEGNRLRTIVSIPSNATSPLPAVLLIQGGGCGSIEIPVGQMTGQPELVHAIGRQAFITMRVEKSGVGDSEGPPCSAISYYEELAGYQAALRTLTSHSAVDPNRIFLLGISLGGTFAPIVARENRIAGVVVFGTLAGPPPTFPGRSRQFFQEFAGVDVLAAWRAVAAPVLVIHGEYDEVTTQASHTKIASAVNLAHPGRARHVELPSLDHCWSKHASREASINNCGGGEKTTDLSDLILGFLREHS
jgi:dienelactone hydrolase